MTCPEEEKMSKQHVMIIDDEPDIRQVIAAILTEEGYDVSTADSGQSARRLLAHTQPDIILLDIWMPDEDGISLLKDGMNSGQICCPVLMMSGHATVETAIEATRLGAHDLLEKPISMRKLLDSVRQTLSSRPAIHDTTDLRQRGAGICIEPVGRSAAMKTLREHARKLAHHDTPILLVGESGTGKETFARYIHSLSTRSNAPIMEFNVNAIDPEAVLPELLGQETDGNILPGILELARGGTLLIEEVTDLDAETQARLNSILESGTYSRTGGTELLPLDIRIIATTFRNPDEEIHLGNLRRDLLDQINVVTLRLPPLEERAEDIPELLEQIVNDFVNNSLSSRQELRYRKFPVSVQNYLRNLAWPGNIRELRNLVQRLLILGGTEAVSIDEVKSALEENRAAFRRNNPSDFFELPLKDARERFEKAYLEYRLDKLNGSVSKLAGDIQIERTHLYRKLNTLGIKFKDKR